MIRRSLFAIIPMLSLVSCAVPGHVAEEPVIRPSEVTDFHLLYAQNCSGCHGPNGQGALSVAIGKPVYLAITDDPTIKRVIEEGRTGTAMQPFSQKAGGFLTGAQIDALVRGIRAWSRPGNLDSSPPAYAASLTGNAERSKAVFGEYCSSCHGADGNGARAIADPSYLALVSDQHLRTVVIAGMPDSGFPDMGMPDWRGYTTPLTDADVTDVVAWLAMHRLPSPASLNHGLSRGLNHGGGLE